MTYIQCSDMNCVPLKIGLNLQHLVSVNETLFGNRTFAGVIKYLNDGRRMTRDVERIM